MSSFQLEINSGKKKKYGEADEMRDSILKLGIIINDGENVGWYWKDS